MSESASRDTARQTAPVLPPVVPADEQRHLAPATNPTRLGVHLRAGGVDAAVFAENADSVEVCLVDVDEAGRRSQRRVALPHRVNGIWHAHLPGVSAGQHYGVRVHGPWRPGEGHRFNSAKLLLDPYARAVVPPGRMGPELFGHTVDHHLMGDPYVASTVDSLATAPLGVVVDEAFEWGADRRPGIGWDDTVIYEAHVKGLTMRHPGVPDEIRGSYQALGHPAVLSHLNELGITTIELLPVHASVTEAWLTQQGLTNYWGYNTLGFFAPDTRFSAAARHDGSPRAVIDEFKTMVRNLHTAGIEVVLDVVYNHTCEGGNGGPTLSWRGLDNAAYYRTSGVLYPDTTGTGNSLNFGHPEVIKQVLDSLRYWVEVMHVDGFRFDLMTTLARGRDGSFTPDHPLLVALRADPVLREVKLIAEPWDIGYGGWQTGRFGIPLAEWNDRYRDSIRDFWLTGGAAERAGRPGPGVRDLATRLAGSEDLFSYLRGPLASVNYIASHDGFTLADLTMYNDRRNEANGEDNRDGSADNRSDNHGVEGPTADRGVVASRAATTRAMLGTWAVSTGVPMLLAGDELGRTQQGNNNAYCHDSDLTWVDWQYGQAQVDLMDTTRFLLQLRASHPVLRQRAFFTGRTVHADGTKDLAWFTADGDQMNDDEWYDGYRRTLLMYLHGEPAGGDSLLVVFHGGLHAHEVVLPDLPWASRYRMLWTSAAARPGWPKGPIPATSGPGPTDLLPADRLTVAAMTVTILTAQHG